jgi:hypothetical protein
MKIFFLKIGHIGYQKIENFMLNSKKQTCLSDKMAPKKVKIKKRFSNFDKSYFFRFLILTFFGAILSLRQVCFYEFSIKFSIF